MKQSTTAFYNRFSFLYPMIDVFLRPQKKRLFEEINNCPDGDLLEIGVGNGTHLRHYKKHRVTGIDTSSTMLELASRHKQENMELICMNAEELKFENERFDYVVLSHVITVVDDPEMLIDEAYRVLKPDGKIFILNHFTPRNGLRHIDKIVSPFTRALHFKSVFFVDSLNSLKKFKPVKEINFGKLSYFKLLVLSKP